MAAPVWETVLSGEDAEHSVTDLVVDHDGNTIVTGRARGTVSIENESVSTGSFTGYYIASISPSGNPLQLAYFGDGTVDNFGAPLLAPSPAGVMVVVDGAYPLSPGNPSTSIGADITVATWWATSTGRPTFHQGISCDVDTFVVPRAAGAHGDHVALAVDLNTDNCTLPDGSVVTGGGTWLLDFDENGELAWHAPMGGSAFVDSISGLPDGDILLSGAFTSNLTIGGLDLTNDQGRDGFVARLDGETGAAKWGTPIVANGEIIEILSASSGEDTVIFSRLLGNIAFLEEEIIPGPGSGILWAAGLDASDGSLRWLQQYTSLASNRAREVYVDSAGDAVLLASVSDAISFEGQEYSSASPDDTFVAKLGAATGDVRWARMFGGAGNDEAVAGALDASGNFTFAVNFSEECDVGSGPLIPEVGAEDFVITRVGP